VTNSGTVLPAREADISLVIPTRSPLAVASYNLSLLILGVIWEALIASRVEKAAEAFTAVHSNMSEILELRGQTKPFEVTTLETE